MGKKLTASDMAKLKWAAMSPKERKAHIAKMSAAAAKARTKAAKARKKSLKRP